MTTTIGSFDLASLKNLRDDVTQYFWFESDSSSAWGSGAHVTLYPESQFTDSTNPNYMNGQNIIMNTDGFSIRNGALPMMVLDNDSLDFNAVDTSLGTYTKMATFGLIGMQIYSRDSNNNLVQLANIGYGATQGETTVVTSPYYLLGKPRPSSDFPQYDSTSYEHLVGERCTYNGTKYVCKESHSMGAFDASKWSLAIGQYSMAEGHNCIASGINSHAEGASTTAIGYESHSEGNNTLALGNCSHAEGLNTKATGRFSHVQGEYTIAVSECSTIIGRYNDPSEHAYCALQIGNGNDPSSRSNALTVDWSGDVYLALDTTAQSGTDYDLYNAITALGWQSDVIV